jgi:hypothetical protein
MAKTTRRDFPVATMKKLALGIFNPDIVDEKNRIKSEIIADYDQNEGKAVLDEIAALEFNSKQMKALKGLDKTRNGFKTILVSPTVTEDQIKKVCKELSVDYQAKFSGETDLQTIANELLPMVLSGLSENSKVIATCAAKKQRFVELSAKYRSERKPVLKDWRLMYRKLVSDSRAKILADPELVELKKSREGLKSAEAKEVRAKILERESFLQEESKKQLTDTSVIAGLLNVDPLIAERYSHIFTRRQAIDELSSQCIRIAKLPEVLSMLSTHLTRAVVNHTRTSLLSDRDRCNLKVTVADLKGSSPESQPAIVLGQCSKTKKAIDGGLAYDIPAGAELFSIPVKKIIDNTLKGLHWEKDARLAICAIVHDSIVALTHMFKTTVTGKAKTLSRVGITGIIHTYLSSHQIEDISMFDSDLNEIFAHKK